ncbi:MAG: SUMF1/EgtB/PvdO family nonheme iron enzyme [Verrucomicrobia bacterium]|nr:SUMF1/EgtB/PvdO family nonheme iron enzyme [Verrucomicrobiota bacterium]
MQDKLQQFHDFLTKFHISLDTWKNSDFAVEGRRLFKRLTAERQQIAGTAAKILDAARKIAIAQLVVAIALLGLGLRFWAVLWPLLVPVAGFAVAWKFWQWLHARLVERTTIQFRLEANGHTVEDPQMAVIFLNGQPYRTGMRIAPGTYQLTLDVSLFEPFTRTITVGLGRSNDLGALPVRLNRQTFINSLDMRFVPVPASSVLFSIWPTRVLDYALFVHALKHPWTRPNFKQDPDHPVVNVTWHDAVAFCDWLTEKERREKKIGENDTYRLPTDLEWSAAVELGKETGATPAERDGQIADVFPWGKQWPPPRNAGNYDPELRVDGFDFTSPVGSFSPNSQGLHDLGGNVWEWCHDFYNGEQKYRTLRGGSWRSAKSSQLLSSARLFDSPGHRVNIIGFRVVLEVRKPSPLLQGRVIDAAPAGTVPAQPITSPAEAARANPV